MGTRQMELPDYVAALPPLDSLPIAIERHERAGGLDGADRPELERPALPRRHDRAAAAAHAARALLDDAKQDAAETVDRARAEAKTVLEQARAEAKAQLEQARAEARKLKPSERPEPAPLAQRRAESAATDAWAFPFPPPPLSPEDIATSRPLPRFFGRPGERRLLSDARAA